MKWLRLARDLLYPLSFGLALSMSAHTKKAFRSCRRQGNEMDWAGGGSVAQHKAIAAVRKCQSPPSAEQIHSSPLLLVTVFPDGLCQEGR